jgi:hypothetical protein
MYNHEVRLIGLARRYLDATRRRGHFVNMRIMMEEGEEGLFSVHKAVETFSASAL